MTADRVLHLIGASIMTAVRILKVVEDRKFVIKTTFLTKKDLLCAKSRQEFAYSHFSFEKDRVIFFIKSIAS